MGKCFKGYTITATGDLGKTRTNDALKRWTESNGGKWASKVETGVTHLICTKDHWTRNVQAIQKAVELKCKIITYDWHEDCCLNKARRHTGQYLCSKVFKLSAAERAARKKKERLAAKKEGKFNLLVIYWGFVWFLNLIQSGDLMRVVRLQRLIYIQVRRNLHLLLRRAFLVTGWRIMKQIS